MRASLDSNDEWSAVKSDFVCILFPEVFAEFDPELAADWQLFYDRYRRCLLRKFSHTMPDGRVMAGPSPLSRFRLDNAAAFGYTKEEARFCAAFDGRALRWEAQQSEYGKPENACVPCDICLELKPPWMSTVHKVLGGGQLEAGLRGGSEAWEQWVELECVGRNLCDRCRAPTTRDGRGRDR